MRVLRFFLDGGLVWHDMTVTVRSQVIVMPRRRQSARLAFLAGREGVGMALPARVRCLVRRPATGVCGEGNPGRERLARHEEHGRVERCS